MPPENWRLFSLCHACSIIGNTDNNKNDPEEIRGRLVLKRILIVLLLYHDLFTCSLLSLYNAEYIHAFVKSVFKFQLTVGLWR